MRITEFQTQQITQTIFQLVGKQAQIYLFGSRLNDLAKGGDIDLLIETETRMSMIERAKIKMKLEELLGLQIDILSKTRGEKPTPFQTIAQKQSLRLG